MVSAVSFRSFRFDVSPFSTCRFCIQNKWSIFLSCGILDRIKNYLNMLSNNIPQFRDANFSVIQKN
jgi:hypothetical protein